ncbi:MAG: hypothetical protein ACLKAK_12990 [Alkaliphilus sp.]
MPLNPATLKVLAKVATAAATNENARQDVLIACLVPLMFILLVLASPFAIFFSQTSGDINTEGVPISHTMNSLRLQFNEKIELEKNDSSVDEIKIEIFGSDKNTVTDNSTDVLIVFAVKYNVVEENSMQMAVLSEEQITKLEKVFWDMNTITSEIEINEEEITYTETDENGNLVTRTEIIKRKVKTIYITSFSSLDMAKVYGFSEIQLKILREMQESGMK